MKALSRLVFFLIFSAGCSQSPQEPSIIWLNGKASGLSVPEALIGQAQLQVRLKGQSAAILGEASRLDERIIFTPVLSLRAGMTYEIFADGELKSTLAVPHSAMRRPQVAHVYPSVDTVPENLLKIYVRFSLPMREAGCLQHICVVKENGDTLRDVFLDLQLWDSAATVLTLWLDPGRIKRDLIPNRRLGKPLQAGNRYQLVVDSGMQSAEGEPLGVSYSKMYFVVKRDDVCPNPLLWQVSTPAAGSVNALGIDFGEALDPFLTEEGIEVIGQDGLTWSIHAENHTDASIQLTPLRPWKPGAYILRVKANIEDLAGNSLNAPFDRDVLTQQRKSNRFVERKIVLR